ncbi:hypothetical protein NEFER03_1031 [Nematocida sp. LUAm3]|nr:hypothetical protein NEFER03_1031 [Nematocida sp. LUAm3]KAI5175365.1 hypothetical protein NEFER02_1294 [Nematocida sp. LUAm2]KAI5177678.1 hypothetical protein NEFER01_0902 [Nematocida sp. LUAm1]
MERYFREIEQWRMLSEWKKETILNSLKMHCYLKEWNSLLEHSLLRGRREEYLDRYSRSMYFFLKRRAVAIGYSLKEIESIERIEVKMVKKVKEAEKAYKETQGAVERIKRKMVSSSVSLLQSSSLASGYLIERALLQVLPPNVRMYLVEGKKRILFLWLERKDPFINIRIEILRKAKNLVVIEEETSLSYVQYAVLRSLYPDMKVQKRICQSY